jgi:hypothetical protein
LHPATCLLWVKSAENKLLDLEVFIVALLILFVLVIAGSFSFALLISLSSAIDTVRGIFHILVRFASSINRLHELLQSSSLSSFLGLSRIAWATVGFFLVTITIFFGLAITIAQQSTHILLSVLVIISICLTDDLQCSSWARGFVGILIKLGRLTGVNCGHGDTELTIPRQFGIMLQRLRRYARSKKRTGNT